MCNLSLWCFNHGFKFQDPVCNGCHNLTKLCLNISDIAIITFKGVDCCCIIHGISKYEAFQLLKNSLEFIKMCINEISIKNQVCDCYFNNSMNKKTRNLKIF